MSAEPTTRELMDAMLDFRSAVETRFDCTDEHIMRVETRMTAVEGRLTGVETRLDRVETRLEVLETDMGEVKRHILRKRR